MPRYLYSNQQQYIFYAQYFLLSLFAWGNMMKFVYDRSVKSDALLNLETRSLAFLFKVTSFSSILKISNYQPPKYTLNDVLMARLKINSILPYYYCFKSSNPICRGKICNYKDRSLSQSHKKGRT